MLIVIAISLALSYYQLMNQNVQILKKNGKREWVVVRQAAHDKVVVIGSKLLGGTVVEIR